MDLNWPRGQAAFVTGAASGIGLGISRALVAAGARVALADIDAARVAAAAKALADEGGEVIGLPLDVSDPQQWPQVADRAEAALGPISILCNNAGVSGGGVDGSREIDQTPLEVWRWVYRINVDGQFLGVSTFLPRFKARGGRAHIVNTASMVGLAPITRMAAYSSSKFASVGFSLVLRDELQGSEVGASLLCPGNVATRIAETSGEAEAGLLHQTLDRDLLDRTAAISAQGADPDLVGRQVVEAMQQRQFLIITHREWAPLVEAVHGEIRRAFSEFDGRYGPDMSALALAQGVNPIPAASLG